MMGRILVGERDRDFKVNATGGWGGERGKGTLYKEKEVNGKSWIGDPA